MFDFGIGWVGESCVLGRWYVRFDISPFGCVFATVNDGVLDGESMKFFPTVG